MAELRPKMRELREGTGSRESRDEKREERRAYIEGGARRIVGSRRDDGEAVGGELRARVEIEGLEAVVGDLGHGSRMEE